MNIKFIAIIAAWLMLGGTALLVQDDTLSFWYDKPAPD